MRKLICLLVAAACLATATGVASADDRYVALGDSYSAGTGSGPYTLDARCQRSPSAYPYLESRARPGTTLVFVACAGATTTDVLDSQLAALTPQTRLASITIGGNDAGFSGVVRACVTIGCPPAILRAAAFVRAELPRRLDAVYDAIRRRAPDATVAVLGYPRLFGATGCAATIGVITTERRRLNQLADLLDATIARRAAAHGFHYLSAIARFARHPVCAHDGWLHGIVPFSASESFHPTSRGHADGYLPLLRSALG
ncbi:MAG TPA: SGNH/GDSL hydrolase family protein [Conexibacter sp.]|jgi:lysophospholipase L1-like esterase